MTPPLALLDIPQSALLLLVGFAAGMLGGLLGVGGGIIMIPALFLILGQTFGDNSFHVYKLAAMTTAIVLSIPAVTRHIRAGAVVFPMQLGIVPAAIVGVAAGVALAGRFDDQHTHLLRRIFGGFLLLVVAFQVGQRWVARNGERTVRDRCPISSRRTLLALAVGLPAGIVAGLLGIGGGVWAVPMQQLGFGVRVRHAIANSAFMILFVAPATAIALSVSIAGMQSARPADGLLLAAWLSPGALVGGWCGAALTHRLPVGKVWAAFQVLLVAAGLRLLLGG